MPKHVVTVNVRIFSPWQLHILTYGYTYNQTYKRTDSDYDATLIQLNSDGSYDNSFNGNDIKIYPKAGTDQFTSNLALQSNGKLLLVANTGLTRLFSE